MQHLSSSQQEVRIAIKLYHCDEIGHCDETGGSVNWKSEFNLVALKCFKNLKLQYYALSVLIGLIFGCGTIASALTVMPIGDSNTFGYGDAGVGSTEGYRMPLDQLMQQSGIQIQYVGGEVDTRASGYGNNHHEGHIGWTIDDIINGRDGKSPMSWLYAIQPDVVLLMIGTNDLSVGHDVGYMQWRMSYLLDVIHFYSPRSKIIVGSLLPFVQIPYYLGQEPQAWNPFNASIDQFNGFLANEVSSRQRRGIQIRLANVNGYVSYDKMSDFNSNYGWIGLAVHADQLGYRFMAYAWLAQLAGF